MKSVLIRVSSWVEKAVSVFLSLHKWQHLRKKGNTINSGRKSKSPTKQQQQSTDLFFPVWPRAPDCCILLLCSPWWSWCRCSCAEFGLQGGTGSASRWHTDPSLCCWRRKMIVQAHTGDQIKLERWTIWQNRAFIKGAKYFIYTYRRRLFLDFIDGGMVCLVSMLPNRRVR